MELELITRRPSGAAKLTPLLFVHGAWHAAWCWDEHFLPYFAEQGYLAYALSLRGHGASPNNKMLRLTGAWDYVADVAQIVARIQAETGQRPAVIGHSMGGYVVQKYLERHTAPAAVLLASIPVVGTLPFTLRTLWNHPVAALKLTLTLSAKPIVSTPELAKAHFFSESMPLEQVARYQARLGDESVRMLLDAGFLKRPRPDKINPTPILVIAAENDRVFPIREQEATARAYNTQLVVIPETAHDIMLEPRWQEAADKIIAWLDTRDAES